MPFSGNYLIIDSTGAELFLAAGNAEKSVYFCGDATARRHSAEILVQAEKLLNGLGLTPSDLDVVGAVTGPGSFTGIRIGVTTANALKRAVNARLAAFTSLEALTFDETRVLALMDCKHSNYYALLKDGGEESYFAASSDELDRDFPDLKRIYYSAPDAEKYIKCFLAKCEKGDFVRIACPFYIKKSSAEA